MKIAASVPLPHDSEELRSRLTLLGTAWVMVSFQLTGNELVKDLRPYIFTEYCDYLLGKHVWGLTALGSDGRHFGNPSWTLLLQYEHEIRAQAYSMMETRGVPLDQALKQAWCDQTTRDRYFLTPLALEQRRRPMDRDHRDDGARPHKKSKTEKRNEKKAAMTKGEQRSPRAKAKALVSPLVARLRHLMVRRSALTSIPRG